MKINYKKRGFVPLSLTIIICSILLVVGNIDNKRAQAAPSLDSLMVDVESSTDDCAELGLQSASVILDGVALNFCLSFLPPDGLIASEPDNAIQVASVIEWEEVFQEFSVTAVPYGAQSPSENLPVAKANGEDLYRQLLEDYRKQQGGNPEPGSILDLFGQQVEGSVSIVDLYIDVFEPKQVAVAEWVVDAGERLWIFRASQEIVQRNGETLQNQANSFTASLENASVTSDNIDAPSTSLAAHDNPPVVDWAESLSPTDDLPFPVWWNGECDTNNYSAQSGGIGAYPLGASFRGVKACGPRPHHDGVDNVLVRFFPGAWGEYEWQCVELSMRFMYLAYGINPYGANGKDVVPNYSGDVLEKVNNGTINKAPQPGDVLSYGAVSLYGHTTVVTASSVDSQGNGSITIMEQNAMANGERFHTVSNWYVQDGQGIVGWLRGDGNPGNPGNPGDPGDGSGNDDPGTMFIARHSDKCIDVKDWSMDDGDPIQQWECTGNDNQLWNFEPVGNDGYGRFVSEHSGKCLDLTDWSTENGAPIQQWECHDDAGANQLWKPELMGQYYQLVSKHSGKCLDIEQTDYDNGSPLQQWDCWGSENQQWQVVSVNVYDEIVAAHSYKCLDVKDWSQDNDAIIQQWDCHGGENQAWKLRPVDDEYYNIIVEDTGKCLDVKDESLDSGATIQQWDCWGGNNQAWQVEPIGDEYFRFIAKHSDMCLEVVNEDVGNGAELVQNICDPDKSLSSQAFYIAAHEDVLLSNDWAYVGPGIKLRDNNRASVRIAVVDVDHAGVELELASNYINDSDGHWNYERKPLNELVLNNSGAQFDNFSYPSVAINGVGFGCYNEGVDDDEGIDERGFASGSILLDSDRYTISVDKGPSFLIYGESTEDLPQIYSINRDSPFRDGVDGENGYDATKVESIITNTEGIDFATGFYVTFVYPVDGVPEYQPLSIPSWLLHPIEYARYTHIANGRKTAVAISKDRQSIFMATVNGNVDFETFAEALIAAGAYKAVLLDGGGSSQFYSYGSARVEQNNRVLNDPTDCKQEDDQARWIINGIVAYNPDTQFDHSWSNGAIWAGTYTLPYEIEVNIVEGTFIPSAQTMLANVPSVTNTSVNTVTIQYEPQPITPTFPLLNIGRFYTLDAVYDDDSPAIPQKPYRVTVYYNERNLPCALDEADLALYYWNGQDWELSPASEVYPDGNYVTAEPPQFGLFAILAADTYPPESYSIVSCAQPGNEGACLSDAFLSFGGFDLQTGITNTMYSLNGSSFIEYTSPVTVTEEGISTFEFYSTDKADNAGETIQGQILIDKTLPTSALTLTPPLPAGESTYMVDATVMITATDNGDPAVASGLDYIEYRLNGGAWLHYDSDDLPVISQNGENILEYRSVDVAGNLESSHSETIVLDKTAYTLVPLDPVQTNRRAAYKAVFQAIDAGRYPLLTAATIEVEGVSYPAGTIIVEGELSGDFVKATITDTSALDAYVLYPADIAIFESSSEDDRASWEVVDFQRLFQTYLWSDYAQIVNEDELAAGLPGKKVLLIPAGLTEDVIGRLEAADAWTGLQTFTQNGGWIYTQGDSSLLLELAGLLPDGTVGNGLNMTGQATLSVELSDSPLTYNWVTNDVAVFKDAPLFDILGDMMEIASYADSGLPALIMQSVGDGGVILSGPHPTQNSNTYPLVLDALFLAQSSRLRTHVDVQQQYYPGVEQDVIPAFEIGIPLQITTGIDNYGEAVNDFEYHEVITTSFSLLGAPSVSMGDVFTQVITDGIEIIWTADVLPSGKHDLSYQVQTVYSDTLKQGEVVISSALMSYTDNDRTVTLNRDLAVVQAKLAAMIAHTSGSEPNNFYPLPAEGAYVHVREDLVNKLDTRANNIVFTTTIPLIDIIRDAYDQSVFAPVDPDYYCSPNPIIDLDETHIFVKNSVSGYAERDYPTPTGAVGSDWIYTLENWDGYTWVRIPNPNHIRVNILDDYRDFIIQEDETGDLLVPGVTLSFNLDTMLPYDQRSPAIRYLIRSQELLERGVSFNTQPVTNTVVLEGSGGSAYIAVGQHPIPFREYVVSGGINSPIAPVSSELTYTDIWGRSHVITESVMSDFYDIIPPGVGPGPEGHDVNFNITTGMTGESGEMLLDYPTYQTVTVTALIKLESINWDMSLEDMVVQYLMPTGFRYDIESVGWTSSGGDFQLLDDELMDIPAFRIFNFQGAITADSPATITLIARLRTYENVPYEGDFLVNGGGRIAARNIWPSGPSQYEFMYTNVHVEQGYQVDIEANKEIAPVGISVHGGEVYEIYTVEEPNDPRRYTNEVYMDATLGGDKTAQARVGMSWGSELYFANVSPGGETLFCLELSNNTGERWSDIAVSPLPPDGIVVEEIFTGIEGPPNIYEQPYMWALAVPDISHGTYCWRATVSADLPGGVMYPIEFSLYGTNLPPVDEFPMPTALIGVEDGEGSVYHVLGEGLLSDTITDTTILEANPQTPVIVTDTQLDTFVDLLNEDFDNDTDTAAIYLDTITTTMSYSVTVPVSATEKIVTYDVPTKYRCLPCQDGTDFTSSFHFVVPIELDALENGRQPVNYGFFAPYEDPFGVIFTAASNGTEVIAHGPEMTGSYSVISITNSFDSGWRIDLAPGEENIVDVLVNIWNGGDYPAITPTITITMADGVNLLNADPMWSTRDGQQYSWNYASVLPVDREAIALTLSITPTTSTMNLHTSQAVGYVSLIDGSWADYVDGYANIDVSESIGGVFQLPIGIQTVYLPIIMMPGAAPPAPDLIVESATITAQEATVVIVNQGSAPVHAENGFWIDLYINPNPIPTQVNEILDDNGRSEYGAVWAVTQSLAPGEKLILTLHDGYYSDIRSRLPASFAPNSVVYVQVDSYNPGNSYGAVREIHEINGGVYNNILGPVIGNSD